MMNRHFPKGQMGTRQGEGERKGKILGDSSAPASLNHGGDGEQG